jgi:organic radical activating enzyme
MLPIHEVFYTWQGEGVHMGLPAFFIRTFGCPLHCPWCDSAGTWHKDYIPKEIKKYSITELVLAATASGADIVVITGGEPTIHDLTELTEALRAVGLRTHLETSGAFEIKGRFDWITISPKRAKPVLLTSLQRANELKLIIEKPEDIDYWEMQAGLLVRADAPVWLHPEWSQRENPAVLNAITLAVKRRLANYRAGWQMHKLYRADSLDKRTAPLAPLGGNPKLGF